MRTAVAAAKKVVMKKRIAIAAATPAAYSYFAAARGVTTINNSLPGNGAAGERNNFSTNAGAAASRSNPATRTDCPSGTRRSAEKRRLLNPPRWGKVNSGRTRRFNVPFPPPRGVNRRRKS
jgi:hypothetical protein